MKSSQPEFYANASLSSQVLYPKHYILNKSENATPELFAIYIQNYANQECNWKCILMFKYWVMHNSKSFTDGVTRKHMKAI